MPIEVKELVIRASVETKRENTTNDQSTDTQAGATADRQLAELMKVKKIIEQKNER